MNKPEALRLADELEDDLADYAGQSLPRISQDIADSAAVELRRLHAENEAMRNVANRGGHIAVAMSRIADLESQRDALLEALRGAQACFITQDITRQEYERLYPDAEEETK